MRWPRFVRNRRSSTRPGSRWCEIPPTKSVLLAGMQGSVLPIAVSHGEGRAEFDAGSGAGRLESLGMTSLQLRRQPRAATERYPFNPNGSPAGLAGVCNADGRVTVLMPHPERVYRAVQNSWQPREWHEDGGWMRLFRNARVFLK